MAILSARMWVKCSAMSAVHTRHQGSFISVVVLVVLRMAICCCFPIARCCSEQGIVGIVHHQGLSHLPGFNKC